MLLSAPRWALERGALVIRSLLRTIVGNYNIVVSR
jgi:hypothetical protein